METLRPAQTSARARPHQGRRADSGGERWIWGRHAVAAALANPARRWSRLVAVEARAETARALAAGALAERRGTGDPVRLLDRDSFAALAPEGAVHQGLLLEAGPLEPALLDDLLRAPGVVIALDEASDPHNVGAVLRSAAAFGARGLILTRHRAPPAAGALAKAASGALEQVPLARVGNLVQAIDRAKAAGFWVCGLAEDAPLTLAAVDLGERALLVLGSEGRGLRRLVRQRCDHIARLPTRPAQPSLNLSNAAAVALYEFARRRA